MERVIDNDWLKRCVMAAPARASKAEIAESLCNMAETKSREMQIIARRNRLMQAQALSAKIEADGDEDHLMRDDLKWPYFYPPFYLPHKLPPDALHEPIIPAPRGWDLGPDGCLSVNDKGAVIQSSRNMLTLDIDIRDPRFHKWAVKDRDQIIHNILDLKAHDDHPARPGWNCGAGTFRWSEENWRLYTTGGGARLICSSRPYTLDDKDRVWRLWRLCEFLCTDPRYAEKCCWANMPCYRMRVTPKGPHDPVVCEYVATYCNDLPVHEAIREQLEFHDAACRR